VYADLYHLTKGVVEQRNGFATRFLYTLGLSFLAVGGILLA